MKRIQPPTMESSMKELVGSWNRSPRIGKQSETTKGWLRKTKKRRDEQNDFSVELDQGQLHSERLGTINDANLS